MKRHAAMPEHHDLGGMGEIIARIVKQHLAEPSADDDAERAIDEKVLDAFGGGPGAAAPVAIVGDDSADQSPAGNQPDDIGERVPAYGERPEMHEHRVDHGIWQQENGHRRRPDAMREKRGQERKTARRMIGPCNFRPLQNFIQIAARRSGPAPSSSNLWGKGSANPVNGSLRRSIELRLSAEIGFHSCSLELRPKLMESLAMRLALVVKIAAVVVLVAFVSTAFFDASAFAFLRDPPSQNPLWLLMSLLAAGCSAKLTVAVPEFGSNAHLSAPLFAALAAPYFLRFVAWDLGLRTFTARFRAQPPPGAGGDQGFASPLSPRRACRLAGPRRGGARRGGAGAKMTWRLG